MTPIVYERTHTWETLLYPLFSPMTHIWDLFLSPVLVGKHPSVQIPDFCTGLACLSSI